MNALSRRGQGIPHDGGFGYKNLRKYEEHRPDTRATGAATIPVDQTIGATPAPRGDVMFDDASLEEPRLEHNTAYYEVNSNLWLQKSWQVLNVVL